MAVLLAILPWLALQSAAQEPRAAAFPGAQGYGAAATGWRGGEVIAVTNLEARGTGSLRDCAERDVPRVCVFQVSGTIELDEPIFAKSDLYIAGQTAPGDGIQLRNRAGATHGPIIAKDADDVVIRFLKLRPGAGDRESSTIDALTVENGTDVYLGNLSLMFASDETFAIHVSSGTSSDITLADSILAYSLDGANHPKGRHSKGALICSEEGQGYECGRISLLRNIFAHHRDRNPDIKATDIGPVEVVNNVFYDPISQFGEFYDHLGNARIAYVGNLAMTGPSTNKRATAAVELFDRVEGNDVRIFAQDNIARSCNGESDLPVLDPLAENLQTDAPIELTLAPAAASDLPGSLIRRAGDVLPDGAHRDRLDQRVITDVSECRGEVIDDPAEVDGWSDIAASDGAADRDGDLLPDAWEEAQDGLDPDRADDPWQVMDGSGMSAVETWLAELAGDA
ncbi:pectate lyase family protein [Paracoccus isoporae]|uniref:pectate lyase family protein n=1 Tax=Paracoccus isoporae TaxID=591205 RepID=UPI000B877B2A|nr:hypothetical protein [Paracoccus isoporae]